MFHHPGVQAIWWENLAWCNFVQAKRETEGNTMGLWRSW
jgi:hypothetical protein